LKILNHFFTITLITFSLISNLNADSNGELSPQRWAELNHILDDIKGDSAPQDLKLSLKTGVITLQSNTQDSVNLGAGGMLAALGVKLDYIFSTHFGLEGSYLFAENAFGGTSSVNPTSSSSTWISAGPRYITYLSQSGVNNYIDFKILYHKVDSNFKLVNDGSIPNPMFMAHYSGVAFGVERSIPISTSFGLVASFDLIQILSASSPSTLGFSQSGYGFDLTGEFYYEWELFHKTSRVGISYWQQGLENDFDNTSKNLTGRNSYLQISRALLANLSFLF
jgi:hypothetical protein